MKSYIIAIIGATLLSAAANILSPENWRKYVAAITGLVIIACIISPISAVMQNDIFDGFENVNEIITDGEDMQYELVKSELSKKINDDIEARLTKEFNLNVRAECDILVNDNDEIERVAYVRIYGDKLTERAKNRICEVYGIGYDEVYDG